VRKDDNSRIHRYYEHSNMLKRLMVALVGMAMGGLAGLVVALMGAGNLAIILGAALGGLVFSVAAPRVGRAA
jgi:Na+(H+)/acetate symporter ActP